MTLPTFDEAPPVAKGPSLVVQIAVLVVLTLVAVGGGWFAGGYLRGEEAPPAAETAKPASVSGHDAPKAGHGEPAADAEGAPGQSPLLVVPLAPITTNLAEPADVWLRMEVSAVFDKAPSDPGLADSIHQDLLAYMRTIKLHQMEGASGFLHLREDLDERAGIRSGGLAKRILIRTLLLE